MNVKTFYSRIYWVMAFYSILLAALTWLEVVSTSMNPIVFTVIACTWLFSYVGCTTIAPDRYLKEFQNHSIFPMLVGAVALISSVVKFSQTGREAPIGIIFVAAFLGAILASAFVNWLLNKYFEPQYVAILKESLLVELEKVRAFHLISRVNINDTNNAEMQALDNLEAYVEASDSLKELKNIGIMIDQYNLGVEYRKILVKYAMGISA